MTRVTMKPQRMAKRIGHPARDPFHTPYGMAHGIDGDSDHASASYPASDKRNEKRSHFDTASAS